MVNTSMKPCGTFLTICLVAGLVSLAKANDYYVAQVAAGTGNSINTPTNTTWFNSATSWNNGSLTIQPGDTVHLVGTITNELTVHGNGSNGAPITIYFETNCILTAPFWPSSGNGNGAITIPRHNYITIDGGYNGVITTTACGTGYTNASSSGVRGLSASHLTVMNLTISNMYLRTNPQDEQGAGACISDSSVWAAYTDFKVLHCTLHDANIGINSDYAAGSANYEFASNIIYNCNWGACCGDRNSASTMIGLSVHDNHFYDWKNWNDTANNNYHHNGIFAWSNAGAFTNGTFYNNTFGPGWGGAYQTSGIYINGNIYGSPLIYNNLFIANSGASVGNGMITLQSFGSTPPTTYRVYNNTFVQTGTRAAVGIQMSGNANNTKFLLMNNVASGLAKFIVIYNDNETPSALTADYNVGWNLDPYGYIDSRTTTGTFLTFAQWRALGRDVHGSSADPQLGINYMPQPGLSTNVIDTGSNLFSTFTIDKHYRPRPATGPWDIGAFQAATGLMPGPPSNLRPIAPAH